MAKRNYILSETTYERIYTIQKAVLKRKDEVQKLRTCMSNEEIKERSALIDLYDMLDMYLEMGDLSYKEAGVCLFPGDIVDEKCWYGRFEVNFCLNRLDEEFRKNEFSAKTRRGSEICSLIDVLRVILVSNDLDWEDGLEPFYWLDLIRQNITQYLDI